MKIFSKTFVLVGIASQLLAVSAFSGEMSENITSSLFCKVTITWPLRPADQRTKTDAFEVKQDGSEVTLFDPAYDQYTLPPIEARKVIAKYSSEKQAYLLDFYSVRNEGKSYGGTIITTKRGGVSSRDVGDGYNKYSNDIDCEVRETGSRNGN